MRCLTKNRTHGSGRGALRDQVKNKKMGYSDQRLLEYVTSTINRYSNIEEEKKAGRRFCPAPMAAGGPMTQQE
jgi:hypothetical protein